MLYPPELRARPLESMTNTRDCFSASRLWQPFPSRNRPRCRVSALEPLDRLDVFSSCGGRSALFALGAGPAPVRTHGHELAGGVQSVADERDRRQSAPPFPRGTTT